jgi:hypothetical protein
VVSLREDMSIVRGCGTFHVRAWETWGSPSPKGEGLCLVSDSSHHIISFVFPILLFSLTIILLLLKNNRAITNPKIMWK